MVGPTPRHSALARTLLRPRRKRAGLLVVAVLAAMLTTISIAADPADASVCSDFPYSGESGMVNSACRENTIDPGVGRLLTRAEMLSGRANALLNTNGYSDQWIWYAPERVRTFRKADNTHWSFCNTFQPGNPAFQSFTSGGFVCDGTLPLGFTEVTGSFNTDVVDLRVFEWGGGFVSRACGNFEEGGASDPIPTIIGDKFHDLNRNGVWDSGEGPRADVTFRLTRLSSDFGGQTIGQSWTTTTNAAGRFSFSMLGRGPGNYRVEEVVPAGWIGTNATSTVIDVNPGVGDRQFDAGDFGNAQNKADVAKTDMVVVNPPAYIDVDTPTDLTISVTIENLGPAYLVPVRDELEIFVPEDCVADQKIRAFNATLTRGIPITRELTFTVTCSRPSEHEFIFEDVLSITDPSITDMNDLNNTATTSLVAPVHAYTDLGVSAVLDCAERTDVGVAADCDVAITVTNDGFGPIDATVAANLSMPDDCVSTPALATLSFTDLADGAVSTRDQTFVVVCSHRSFHEFRTSAAVMADDPHVFDTNPANDTGGDGPSIMEVFHDASMAAVGVHLVCDERIGVTPFMCTATVDYAKTGPAPAVDVVLYAELSELGDCTVAPAERLEQRFILVGSAVQSRSFSWAVTCPENDVLHPFLVTTDIGPSENEPHAVDDPLAISDRWVVPYCLPTVNPHGKKEPQAPGSGMNEDGFYIFGTLPSSEGEPVYIRDDESGVVFGPFDDGTRIKWVEANGAEPTISPMGGNNGNGNGQANAVDYQIRARGDAHSLFIDEEGVEVSVTCLVPPFPK